MSLGLTMDKLVLIALLAVILIGPTRLPDAAAALGRWVRRARSFAQDAKSRVRDEMGPEFDDVDWRSLDPRRYDPRKIIRDALAEPPTVQVRRPGSTDGAGAPEDT